MGNFLTTFLRKEYSISDQIPILVPVLHKFETYKEELFDRLYAQIKSNEYSGGTDGDFAYWNIPISNIARDIITYAAEIGVYDLTEYDLIDNNPGYNKLHQVCDDTSHQMLIALSESVNDYIKGYDEAYTKAASNITGSGVSIWTNSLASALLFSVMEGNVLKKQAKQADKQFDTALRALNDRNTSQRIQKEISIKTKLYYPGCNDSINVLISYMLDSFIKKMDEYGILNLTEIMHYDMKVSSEILKNMQIVPQKAEVLGKAFEKCPYNTNIYANAIDLKLF